MAPSWMDHSSLGQKRVTQPAETLTTTCSSSIYTSTPGPRAPQSSLVAQQDRGYFVFSPFPRPEVVQPPKSTATLEQGISQPESTENGQAEDEARRVQLEKEKKLALEGEMTWVRSGGILRDSYGRRDEARTEQVRKLARVRDEEEQVLTEWTTYETRWRTLLASKESITFNDIPWPVHQTRVKRAKYIPTLAHGPRKDEMDDVLLESLTIVGISDFLLASLGRTNTAELKTRIRTSLLRWHPDKISSVLDRVEPEHAQSVRQGVASVFNALRALQDAEKERERTM